VLLLETLFGWLDERSPGLRRIEAMANELVRRELIDEPVLALTVRAIHTRKKRFTLMTERWAVEGEVILDGGAPEARPRVPYLALVHMICDDAYDHACWVLEQLTYGDRILRLRGRAGSVIN
jgi:hypothetical protein